MIRKTLTIISLLGLLLSMGLWVASYFHFYGILGEGRTFSFSLSCGVFSCSQEYESDENMYRKWLYDLLDLDLDLGPPRNWGFIGYRGLQTSWWPAPFISETTNSITIGALTLRGDSQRSMRLPLWIPTILFFGLIWHSWLSPANRRRKRKKLGLCIKCGYDLRASKERCPECGTEFETT